MEFLDFLKYGAIGISLALALLSYRLLSKEQEKETERPTILKSIKTYMLLTLVLSLFFGLMELLPRLNSENSSGSSTTEQLWNDYFSQYNDSTSRQKLARIRAGLEQASEHTDTLEVCDKYLEQIQQYRDELAAYDIGFYQNIIKLKRQLQNSPDGWINLRFETESKTDLIKLLKTTFISLGYDCNKDSNEAIITKWESMKKTWSNTKSEYLFNSDITELIRLYLKTYEEE